MKTKTGGDLVERREAVFSDCEAYRYSLRITWDASLPICQFIGLNPSTADEMRDDPTVRRCKDFSKRWGCGALIMTNVFAFRATNPDDMMCQVNPTGGAENSEAILRAAQESSIIVAAWGRDGSHGQWGYAVRCLLDGAHHRIQCFKLTKKGEPYHPLYVASTTPLKPLQFFKA